MNDQEEKRLKKFLVELKPIPHLKPEFFETILPLVVTVAVELVIVKGGKILLTWRNDKFYRGWHFPGSIMGVNESFKDTCKRITKEELGVNFKSFKLIDIINNPLDKTNPRNHLVSLLMSCEIKGKSRTGQWFSKCPLDIIPVHKKFWPIIKDYFTQS